MITYKQFVAEVRSLISEGESLKGAAQRDMDPRFRNWRLKLEDRVRQIGKQGYKIHCHSASRRYGGGNFTFSVPSDEVLDEHYNRELEDTLNELRLIGDDFDKYGEPHRDQLAVGSLEPGHVPTVKQLFLALRVHHGWRTAVTIIGIVAAVLYGMFLAGVLYERYIVGRQGEVPQETIEPRIFGQE